MVPGVAIASRKTVGFAARIRPAQAWAPYPWPQVGLRNENPTSTHQPPDQRLAPRQRLDHRIAEGVAEVRIPVSTGIAGAAAGIAKRLFFLFAVGFLVFLPFLIIDLVVSAVLMSMGMMMVPPVIVSMPFKLAFFVVADGWSLVSSALVRSYF